MSSFSFIYSPQKKLIMETLVHYGQKVNQLYEAFNRRELDTILNSLSTDCIWEVMGQPDIPFAGIYLRTKAGVARRGSVGTCCRGLCLRIFQRIERLGFKSG